MPRGHTARVLRVLAFTTVVATTAVACSGGDGGGDADLDSPTAVEATIGPDDDRQRLAVTFSPVDTAEGYVLELDGHEQPIRVDAKVCSDDSCEVWLDRLTVAGAGEATVAAVTGEKTSEPSETVALPDWPDARPQPTTWPEDQPVALAVSTVDDEGRPTVTTETVAAGEDVDARIAHLEAQEGVVGVSVAGPLTSQRLGTDETAPETEDAGEPAGSLPGGLATWQEEAMAFDQLPESRGEGVTIGVVDDGLYTNHTSVNQKDITETNIVEPGRDAPGDHATAVASMIVGDEPWFTPGIATGAEIRAYDVHNLTENDDGELESDIDWSDPARFGAFANAIVAAVDDGVQVINISQAATCIELASAKLYCPDDALRPAVDYAEEKGVVVVASAGNDGDGAEYCDGTNKDTWPAAFSSVISVGGTARDGSRWPCSPDKSYVDVLAPAANLQTAQSPSGYMVASGTSLASPLVAGLVADILAEQPDLTPADLRLYLSAATDENGRLIVPALLQSLGIETGEPPIDLSTGDEFYPLSLGIYLPEHSPVWEVAGTADVGDVDAFERKIKDGIGEPFGATPYYPHGSGAPNWSVLHPFQVMVSGLIKVDGDEVSGIGWMHSYGPHHVECPEWGDPDTPRITWDWRVPVEISGTTRIEEDTNIRDAELSFEFGAESDTGTGRELPGLEVLQDDFDDCAALIAERDTPFSDPEYPWSEVKTWPETQSARTQTVYQAIINAAPFAIEDAYFPPKDATGDEAATANHVYASGEDYDDFAYKLQIGTTDTFQLELNY